MYSVQVQSVLSSWQAGKEYYVTDIMVKFSYAKDFYKSQMCCSRTGICLTVWGILLSSKHHQQSFPFSCDTFGFYCFSLTSLSTLCSCTLSPRGSTAQYLHCNILGYKDDSAIHRSSKHKEREEGGLCRKKNKIHFQN